jgi:hypothetical protein
LARSWEVVPHLIYIYKLEALEAMKGGSEQVYAEELLSQIHFYAGKPLRRAPLRAIYGRFIHLISVPSVLLGSRDLVEQD